MPHFIADESSNEEHYFLRVIPRHLATGQPENVQLSTEMHKQSYNCTHKCTTLLSNYIYFGFCDRIQVCLINVKCSDMTQGWKIVKLIRSVEKKAN